MDKEIDKQYVESLLGDLSTDELQHYGIPGMKWGVKKHPRHPDSEKVRQIRKKKIKELSNQDLKDANNRLNLERQYKDYTKRKNAAKHAVTSFIKTAGTISAIVAAAATYKKFGNQIMNKIGDWAISGITNLKV